MKSFLSPLFLLFAAFCSLLLSACGPSGDNFRIDGRIRGMQGGQIFVCIPSENENARFDTIVVKEENFRYLSNVTEPTPLLLIFPNGVEQVIIVSGGQALNYEARSTDLANYTVKGSEENEALNDFRKSVHRKDESTTRARAKKFIEKHPDYLASVWLFSRYYTQNDRIGVKDMTPLLKLLRKHQPNNHTLLNIASGLQMLQRGQVGASLPSLTLTTQRKRTLQLNKPQHNYTLIYFWASWLRQKWDILTYMRETQQAHAAQLNVIPISLDTQIFQWEQDIQSDSLQLQHVCDGKAFDSPSARQLGITHIPTWILADRHARILYRGTQLDSLRHTLDSLFQ